MNVLRVEEMYNLEEILRENPETIIADRNKYRPFEITYLKRAVRLPIQTVNYAINYCEKRHFAKDRLIVMLCETFEISSKEAENRLREVKKINRYRENIATLKLQQKASN